MRKSVLYTLVLYLATFSSIGVTAESVEQAVTQIAEQFVDSQKNTTEEPIRLAVTPFVQSGRNTQFSDLLLIALTGKMVQLGSDIFQVVEKAQAERALREIVDGSAGRGIFDPKSTQQLGNVLSVEALTIGEITPLTNRVRIDARLVVVETNKILKTASVWVPLTPTVQRQLDAVTRRSTVNFGGNEPDLRNGIWSGTGQCGDLLFGIALSVLVDAEDNIVAMQTYYPLNTGDTPLEPGVFTMEGKIDPDNGEFTLSLDSWMFHPRGHTVSGFSGVLDTDSGTIRASYSVEGCSDIRLKKE